MNSTIKKLLLNVISSSHIPELYQRVTQPKSITIVTYHAVIKEPLAFPDWCFMDAELFEAQIAYLSSKFKIISLSEAVEKINNNCLDDRYAVITFDDGYKNNFDIALPILEKYNAPATIYLVTSLINTNKVFWFTRLLSALNNTREESITWEGVRLKLSSVEDKAESSQKLQQSLKAYNEETAQIKLTEIERLLKVEGTLHIPASSAFSMLSKDELGRMIDTGLIEFGAHTYSHPILANSTISEQKKQIELSILQTQELTGLPCYHFAYPNGGHNDFNDDTINILKNAGAKSATTMISGPVTADTNLFILNRYPIGSDTSIERFKLMVHNIY